MGVRLTVIIRNYANRIDMKAGKSQMLRQQFRNIHTDYINNNQRNGFKVTFDDTPDLPPPPPRELTAGEFIDELMSERHIIRKPSTITRFRTLLRLN